MDQTSQAVAPLKAGSGACAAAGVGLRDLAGILPLAGGLIASQLPLLLKSFADLWTKPQY